MKEALKKLVFTLAIIFSLPMVGLTQSGIWVELDGQYWQKYDGLRSYGDDYAVRQGSVRPWLGWGLGKSWSIGLMGDLMSFRDRENDGMGQYPIYEANPEDPENPTITGYQSYAIKSAKSNDFFYYGMFVRNAAKIGNKTSLTFSLYGSKGSGDGSLEFYPDWYYAHFYWPCINCLTVVEGPIRQPY